MEISADFTIRTPLSPDPNKLRTKRRDLINKVTEGNLI